MFDMKIATSLRGLEETLNNQDDDIKKIRARPLGGTVCRYWLEKRCKKGEACEYLHENVIDKLPECPNGLSCPRIRDCPFKHTPRVVKECQFYMNGYCKDGKNCKSLHVKRELCLNYTLGFCPDGPNCKLYHLRALINP
jgi:cleavage and polyadenylation specificity factor subunit 4